MLNLTVSSLIKNYCMKEFLNKLRVFKYCLKILTSTSFVRLAILSLFISISLNFWSQSIEEKTTTGSGSWVCPANVYQVSVECWAGGGGGGSRILHHRCGVRAADEDTAVQRLCISHPHRPLAARRALRGAPRPGAAPAARDAARGAVLARGVRDAGGAPDGGGAAGVWGGGAEGVWL